jgi:hypothetical protein
MDVCFNWVWKDFIPGVDKDLGIRRRREAEEYIKKFGYGKY